jgi:uncharacterized membrane protein
MNRALAAFVGIFAVCLGVWVWAADPKASEGVLPLGADGKPLNLDFETGTLKDWTATGDAFAKQPVKGDLVAARRSDMKSQHQGQYWIGGFEVVGGVPVCRGNDAANAGGDRVGGGQVGDLQDVGGRGGESWPRRGRSAQTSG